MEIEAVAVELEAALRTIDGLHVAPWGVEQVQGAATAVIDGPERISFDQTYGRGVDTLEDWQVFVLAPNTNVRTALRQLARFAAGAGPLSVKAALEGHPYTACDPDGVHVEWAEFDTARYAAQDFLALIFHLNITGQGAAP